MSETSPQAAAPVHWWSFPACRSSRPMKQERCTLIAHWHACATINNKLFRLLCFAMTAWQENLFSSPIKLGAANDLSARDNCGRKMICTLLLSHESFGVDVVFAAVAVASHAWMIEIKFVIGQPGLRLPATNVSLASKDDGSPILIRT